MINKIRKKKLRNLMFCQNKEIKRVNKVKYSFYRGVFKVGGGCNALLPPRN